MRLPSDWILHLHVPLYVAVGLASQSHCKHWEVKLRLEMRTWLNACIVGWAPRKIEEKCREQVPEHMNEDQQQLPLDSLVWGFPRWSYPYIIIIPGSHNVYTFSSFSFRWCIKWSNYSRTRVTNSLGFFVFITVECLNGESWKKKQLHEVIVSMVTVCSVKPQLRLLQLRSYCTTVGWHHQLPIQFPPFHLCTN